MLKPGLARIFDQEVQIDTRRSNWEMSLKNNSLLHKVAIVTGGTRGIGRAIVLAICRAGADCAFTYSSKRDAAESLSEEVQRLGRRALPIQLDVRDFEGAKTLVETVKTAFGQLDILINNAGITRDKSLMMMSQEDWADVIDTTSPGSSILPARALLRLSRKVETSSIFLP